MPPINQKHGVPRIAGGRPFSISRGKFLDGTCKTYYGPGQPPNASPEPGVISPDGTEGELPYAPPTDWPSAGRLLRVPQCVYLSALLTDYARTLPYRYFATEPGGGYYVPLTYDHSIPPIYAIEYARLKPVFDDAKATIESLRPGRTWVQDVDWLPADWEHPIGIRPNNEHYAVRGRGCLHMLAPPVDADPYFGLDFLHVYAGMKAFDSTTYEYPDYFYERFISDVSTAAPADDFNHQLARPRVVAAYPNFRRYAAKLYGVDLPYTPWPPWVDIVLNSTYAGNISLQAGLDAYNAEQRDAIIGQMLLFRAVRDDSNNFLAASAIDLADYGFSYDGITSDLTAPSLVATIADHFGFDPGTGKDLG